MCSQSKSAEPRTEIDARTALAAERTLLAWVRTGLALMGFGFVVARFGLFMRELTAAEHLPTRQHGGLSFWFGGGLMGLGVAVLALAGVQHVRLMRRLAAGEPFRVGTLSLAVVFTFALAAFGLAMTAYLIYSTR